jgi:hypothetical protein
MPEQQDQRRPVRCPLPKWVRRLGLAGFLFFFVKGLVWLGLAGGAALGFISLR